MVQINWPVYIPAGASLGAYFLGMKWMNINYRNGLQLYSKITYTDILIAQWGNISKNPFYEHGLPLIPAWINDYIHF